MNKEKNNFSMITIDRIIEETDYDVSITSKYIYIISRWYPKRRAFKLGTENLDFKIKRYVGLDDE